MKYLLLLLLLTVAGCDNWTYEVNIKTPARVIAKSPEVIIVMQQDSVMMSIAKETYHGRALISTFNVGDTIK